MIKYKAKIISIAIAALVTGAVVGYNEYRKESSKKEITINWGYFAVSPQEFTNIYDSSLKVNRSLTLEEKCNGSLTMNHYASGILLRDSQTQENYILTAEHVTVNQSYRCQEGFPEKRIKIKNGSITVSGFSATVVKESEEADLALLKIEGNIADASPYKGKIAHQVNLGDLVIGTGYPDGKRPYSISYVKQIKENTTILSFNSIGGNSGGGFYRFTNQGLELIGTTRGGTAITTLGRLHELIKDTPLEDDYLQ